MRLLFLLLLFTIGAKAQHGIYKLQSLDNKEVSIDVKKQITVFVFLSPECPLCQSYTLTLNKMQKQYESKNVKIIGVFTGMHYSFNELLEFKKTYNIAFQLLVDIDGKLIPVFKPEVTPEAVVLNQKGIVMYQGRIDNWAYELGRKRSVITEKDLDNALKEVTANKPVTIKRTKAIGCFIELP